MKFRIKEIKMSVRAIFYMKVFAICLAVLFACDTMVNNNDNGDIYDNGNDCACTEILVSLTVKITEAGTPVTNLSLIVSNSESGKLYTNIRQESFINQGRYIYFNDSYVSELTTNVTPLVVEGFISNQKQFSELYGVNTDACKCHVQKVFGKDEIVLDNMSDCICTTSFDLLTVKITKEGEPVTNLSLVVSNSESGKLYTNISHESIAQGRYVYFNDSYVSELTTNVTPLVVEGFLSNQKQFSELYGVNTGACKCHVQKVFGKDEILLGSSNN